MRVSLVLSCLLPCAVMLSMAPPAAHAAQASASACRFESLSAADQRRYQSRYQRRLRNDGAAVADQWLHEQACMTPEQRRAARGKSSRRGECTKTRTEMRVTPGFDGAMTMAPMVVCAN